MWTSQSEYRRARRHGLWRGVISSSSANGKGGRRRTAGRRGSQCVASRGRICYGARAPAVPAPCRVSPPTPMSDGSLRPSMKLLFVILAHDRPAEAAELARTLVAAALGRPGADPLRRPRRRRAAFDGARGGGGGRAADRPRRAPRRLPLGRLRPGRGAAQRARPGRGRGPVARLRDPAVGRLPALPAGGEPRALPRRERRARVHRVRGRELDHRRLALGALALLALVRPQDPAPAELALGAASRRRSGCGGASRPGSSRASARSGGR